MLFRSSLCFTAPTNKALNVIKNKVSDKIKYLLNLHNINYDDKLSFDMNCDRLKKKNIIIEFQTIHKLLKFKTESYPTASRCNLKARLLITPIDS